MIVTEHKLREIFNSLPEVLLHNSNVKVKPFFSWGDKLALDKYIKGYQSNCYPLIWLLPSEEVENRRANTITRRCVFIIATLETNVELYNAERYVGSYDNTLNPLAEYVKESIDRSSNVRLVDPTDITQFKQPNYSDEEDNGTIDLWDATRLEIEIEFNNECFKPISWDV